MDLDRKWTQFSVDAEIDYYGSARIVGSHNELRAEVKRLREKVLLLESALIDATKWFVTANSIYEGSPEEVQKLLTRQLESE